MNCFQLIADSAWQSAFIRPERYDRVHQHPFEVQGW